MYIKCRVKTNVDWLHTKSWPKQVPCKPVIGEKMVATDGTRAKIIDIYYSTSYKLEPILEIEVWEQPK